MDNQHKKIKGYRDLNESEIALMNEIKEKAAEVGELVERLENRTGQQDEAEQVHLDLRWLAIGRTDLQKGFMALTRAVTRPGFF